MITVSHFLNHTNGIIYTYSLMSQLSKYDFKIYSDTYLELKVSYIEYHSEVQGDAICVISTTLRLHCKPV